MEITFDLKNVKNLFKVKYSLIQKAKIDGVKLSEFWNKLSAAIVSDDFGDKLIITDRHFNYTIVLNNKLNRTQSEQGTFDSSQEFVYGVTPKTLFTGLYLLSKRSGTELCRVTLEENKATFSSGNMSFIASRVTDIPANIDFLKAFSTRRQGSFVFEKSVWLDAINEWRGLKGAVPGLLKMLVEDVFHSRVNISLFATDELLGHRKKLYDAHKEVEDPKPDVSVDCRMEENLLEPRFCLGYYDVDYIEAALYGVTGDLVRAAVYYVSGFVVLSLSSYDDREHAIISPVAFV